jgi:hypothetical protein
VGPIDGADHPLAEREVGADPSAVGQHRLIVRPRCGSPPLAGTVLAFRR